MHYTSYPPIIGVVELYLFDQKNWANKHSLLPSQLGAELKISGVYCAVKYF
jgi:hypothetical protein